MSGYVVVDESKRRGALLITSVVVPADLEPTRKVLRGLALRRKGPDLLRCYGAPC